jgi:hypothetical protein
MCGCKNCKDITMPIGQDGVGIANIASNSFGTVTYTYTNGQTVTLPCSCAQSQVYYRTERLGNNTSGSSPTYTVLTNMTYTVPSGGAGTYKLMLVADTQFTYTVAGSAAVTLKVYKNGVELEPNLTKRITTTNTGSGAASYIIPALIMASNITLAVGDVIDVRSTSTAPADAYLNFGVLTIDRLS